MAPRAPTSWREASPDLVVGAFCLVALEILTSLGLSDLKRVLGIEALWFQFGGAGLLWWESNSGASFNVVRKRLEDPGMGWKTPPITSGERISRVIASAIMGGMVLLAAVVLVPLAWELWVRAAPHGWPPGGATEFRALLAALALLVIFLVGARLIHQRTGEVAQAEGTRAGDGLAGMVLLAAVVLVPLAWELWVRAAPHGWPLVETTEFQLLALLLTIVASFSVSVWFIDWRAKKTAQAISRAKTPRDAEWHARRAVRTIGFALVTVGTGLQVYPALCG